MKCFYHSSDLDGICSAAIVKHRHPECECIPINYGYKDDVFDSIVENEIVYMVDFSATREDMKKIIDKTIYFTWIDHHKTAIEKCDGLEISGFREIGKAGCELTWEYLFPDSVIPNAVYYLGRYDVWDHSNKKTLPFQYGMRSENLIPESHMWGNLFDNQGFLSILNKGYVIYDYQISQNKLFARSSFESEFNGLRVICINRSYTNSQVFDSVYDSEKHDAMLTFSFNGEKWTYSIYSTKKEIDVSEIAKSYGGGGHAGAAGFMCDCMINLEYKGKP